MQKLSNAIKDATKDTPEPIELQSAAEEWAVFSIKTFKGKLLKDALAISEAIANFNAELEAPSA